MGGRRLLQKIFAHGNTVGVALHRPVLFQLGWLPGEAVIVELLEDNSGVFVRRPTAADFPNVKAPRFVSNDADTLR